MIALGNLQINRLRLTAPLYGVASADIELANGVDVFGAQTLHVGNLSLSGTVVAGGIVAAVGRQHWVAGRGTWGRMLPAKGYQGTLGVLRSDVLQDLQTALALTGGPADTLSIGIPDMRLGPVQSAYTRPSGPAWDTLKALGVPWYVDAAGVTQIRERTGVEVPADVDVLVNRPEDGYYVVALRDEAYDRWLPGNMIAGARIVTTTIDAVPGEPVRVEIYVRKTHPSHEIRTQLEELIRQQLAYARFLAHYEYRVHTRDGDSYGLVPASPTSGLPPLAGIQMRPGMPGAKADLKIGQSVTIGFENGDPARPYMVQYQPLFAGVPQRSYLDADRVDLGAATYLAAGQSDPVIGPSITFASGVGPPPFVTVTFTDPAGPVYVLTIPGGTVFPTAGVVSTYKIGVPVNTKVYI